MSWLNYEAIQRKVKLLPEEEVAVSVAEVLMCEGFLLQSISSNYKHQNHPRLNDLCQYRHPAGFDLIFIDESWNKMGVEVKPTLTMNSFQSALGQSIAYLHRDTKIKSAIIFARRFQNERTLKIVREIMGKIHEPIMIRTLQTIGQNLIKEIW